MKQSYIPYLQGGMKCLHKRLTCTCTYQYEYHNYHTFVLKNVNILVEYPFICEEFNCEKVYNNVEHVMIFLKKILLMKHQLNAKESCIFTNLRFDVLIRENK